VDVSANATIRAAGGIVHRAAQGDGWELLLVHRPRYDDWSLPKGKADAGETDEETALREVQEETGLRCTLGDAAGETHYRDAKGRSKVVRYWLMEPTTDTGEFTPNDEVDAVHWCSPRDALERLTYDHDRKLLERLEDLS
jgi:8-oxo-dGTP diphosphatase